MTKVTLVKGIPSSGKTEFLLNRIAEVHRADAFSYLVLGPSGSFIRSLRERFLRKIGSFFNDHLLLADQFVVQFLLKKTQKAFYIQRDFLAALIGKLVREDNKLYPLLQKGQGMIDAFLQFYTWLKDHDDASILTGITQTEDALLKEFSGLYTTLNQQMRTMNLFTIEDAYYLFIQQIENGETTHPDIPYRFLFLDGFYDLTPKLRKFFLSFFGFFEEVALSVPFNPDGSAMDASFEKLETDPSPFRSQFQFFSYSTQNMGLPVTDSLKAVFNDILLSKPISEKNPFEVRAFPNPSTESITVCNRVKQILLNSCYTPDDIEIVIRDQRKYTTLLQEGFRENGVPYRVEGDIPFNRSVNIQKILLAFRAYASGFAPDLLLGLLEMGFVPMDDQLPFPEFETLAMSAKLVYSQAYFGSVPVSLQKRKTDWEDRLQNYHNLIQRKKTGASFLEDREELLQDLEQELARLEKATTVVKNLFQGLSFFSKDRKRFSNEEYLQYFNDLVTEYQRRNLLSKSEEEENAARAFLDDLLPNLNRFLYTIEQESENVKTVPLNTFWKYLKIFVDQSSFRESMQIDNRVYISSLENARFREKKIKIFMGITDQYYPMISQSSIFFHSQWPADTVANTPEETLTDTYGQYPGQYVGKTSGGSNTSFREYIIQKEQRDFANAVRSAQEFVLFTYPQADVSGNPYLPSTFLKPLLRYEEIANNNRGSNPLPWEYSLRQFAIHQIASGNGCPPEVLNTLESMRQRSYPVDTVSLPTYWPQYRPSVSSTDTVPKEADKTTRIVALISDLFGDTFSASKYKTMRQCKRKFFYKYLMKIYRSTRIRYGFDYLTEGIILHSVLKKGFSDERSVAIREGIDCFQSIFATAIRQEIRSRMYDGSKVLEQSEVHFFDHTFKNFLSSYPEKMEKIEQKIQSSLTPENFEVEISKNNAKPLHMKSDGTPIYLIGKIDRIDTLSNGDEFIIDYKRTIGNESVDQLLLYAWALQNISKKSVSGISLMEVLKKPKSKGLKMMVTKTPDIIADVTHHGIDADIVFFDPQNKRVKERSIPDVLEEARKQIDLILQGDFSEETKSCYGCEYSSLCSVRRGETQQDDFEQASTTYWPRHRP